MLELSYTSAITYIPFYVIMYRWWKQSKLLVCMVYCFCILKTLLSPEWLTRAVVSGLPLYVFQVKGFSAFLVQKHYMCMCACAHAYTHAHKCYFLVIVLLNQCYCNMNINKYQGCGLLGDFCHED
jgi:dihydroorotase